jgi:hypothetical protein
MRRVESEGLNLADLLLVLATSVGALWAPCRLQGHRYLRSSPEPH